MKHKIILGSSSAARRSVMDKCKLPYKISPPDLDETILPGETALNLVKRLSLAKAQVVGQKHPNSLVIGCDQVASFEAHILGKPMNKETAFEQLRQQSGKEIQFHSGLCLLNTSTQQHQLAVHDTIVKFRDLTDSEIHAYIKHEQPLWSAGSFKCESMGALLVEWVHCDDINGLMGLSLVDLFRLLSNEGVNLLEIIP